MPRKVRAVLGLLPRLHGACAPHLDGAAILRSRRQTGFPTACAAGMQSAGSHQEQGQRMKLLREFFMNTEVQALAG